MLKLLWIEKIDEKTNIILRIVWSKLYIVVLPLYSFTNFIKVDRSALVYILDQVHLVKYRGQFKFSSMASPDFENDGKLYIYTHCLSACVCFKLFKQYI